MTALNEQSRHDEVWLLLPWLTNGRLSAAEREMAEEHIEQCSACQAELALQHRVRDAFAQPDRVVYTPGPSLRKLMDRIEEDSNSSEAPPARDRQRSLVRRLGRVSLWRPPGLAWAASFLLLFAVSGMMLTAYHWAQPNFHVRSDPSPVTAPTVLHIAVDRSLPIGEVEELLQTGGARIVEGPRSTGELGVIPIGIVPGQTTTANANKQLRALSARLRADPRVLWVQPLADDGTPTGPDRSGAADRRATDAQEH